jgi:Ser/Thr protein kinase RdoA (MazF antagonist)
MSPSTRSRQESAGLELAVALLPAWGFPPGARVAPADEQGTNNRTFLVSHGQQRYVLRISGFLSAAEVAAEHRVLRRLRQAGLPFQVPEPVAAPDGRTVIETPAGPATVCRWLPGSLPAMDGEAAFERFGRAMGLLGAALADVPLSDVLRDWRTDPRLVKPDDPPVEVLCGELRSAGMSSGQVELLLAVASRVGRWWPSAAGLPVQVIHGDLATSNVLADPGTGEVTGLLDFEFAGAGYLVQDIAAGVYYCAALGAPDWPRRTAAFLRGCASARRLAPAEVAALPELLIARSLGSVLWRVAKWRAGLMPIGGVTSHAGLLEATMRWLASNEDTFLSVAAAANHGTGRGAVIQ